MDSSMNRVENFATKTPEYGELRMSPCVPRMCLESSYPVGSAFLEEASGLRPRHEAAAALREKDNARRESEPDATRAPGASMVEA